MIHALQSITKFEGGIARVGTEVRSGNMLGRSRAVMGTRLTGRLRFSGNVASAAQISTGIALLRCRIAVPTLLTPIEYINVVRTTPRKSVNGITVSRFRARKTSQNA